LAAGLNINEPDNTGVTPIMASVASENEEMVNFLISSGASVDDPELFFVGVYGAAFSDSTRIIDSLAKAGAPLDAVDEDTGFNAYELVKDMGNEDIARYLKEKYGF
jgi:ankyrin repeat protein